jgi:tetratricopeptide (TPR) repeat protein
MATLLAGRDRHDEAEEYLRNALNHLPKNLSLISQLAEFAQLQGRSGQAIHLLRSSIAIAKESGKPQVELWSRLSAACLHQQDKLAHNAAQKAMELAEAMVEGEDTPEGAVRHAKRLAKNALAQVQSQAQNFTESDIIYRELLEENPWFLPALQGLGQQQMQLGKIDEAIELFERIKAINPAKGYSSLINARQFPDDEETLSRMEKLARQPSMEGSSSSGILFQLAATWEKRKSYDRAMNLAHEANQASRKFLNYNPKAHRQSSARIRHAFPRDLYNNRPNFGNDSTLPVFVLGMPRSGTTLVEQILSGHSQIFGAGELGVIPQVIQGINRWERHVGSSRVYPDCVDDLTEHVIKNIANRVLKELQEYDPEAKHIVDKLPHNFENIGLIKFLFPNAKIISVRRDPRDIALSNYFTDYQAKHGGMGFAYDLTWIGEQLADHNLMMHHWNQVFPNEILEVNYEDVVEHTEREARKMLTYIWVGWEPQVLEFNKLDRPVKTASVWQVRQPIYKTSKAKWLRYKKHLAPLTKGTNAKITWGPIEMITLPQPGFLTDGVTFYKENKLDEAELCFKKLLHHIPDHAAANAMLGIIYARKGHVNEAVELMEKAHKKCPWNPNWRNDLIRAYEMCGEKEKAAKLREKTKQFDSKKIDVTATEDDPWSLPFPDTNQEGQTEL